MSLAQAKLSVEKLHDLQRLGKGFAAAERTRDACTALQCKDPEIEFLGTGSAIPSKYRNVTGIYMNLAHGTDELSDIGDEATGFIMDCGEVARKHLIVEMSLRS